MEASQNSVLAMMEALNKRMEQFEGELNKTSPSTNTTSSLAADFAAFKIFTSQMFRGFQQQFEMLAQNVDNLEMHSRRKILLLHGVAEEKHEETSTLLVKIISNNLKMPEFNSNLIIRCQRMGRVSSNKPRPILVKFHDISERNKVWFSKTKFKGTNFTLSEFLTKTRHDAFMEARQRFGINKCWTRDGCVYVLDPDGKRQRVFNVQELKKITQISTQITTSNVAAPVTHVTAPPSKTRRAATANSRK